MIVRQQRRHIFPRAALVGLGAGLMGAAFRATLARADILRSVLLTWSHSMPFVGWVFPVLFTAAGAGASVALVRRFAPETAGSGIPHLEGVMHRLRALNWRRVLPTKFVAGALAIGGGLPLGREGPTVQMGGAIGDMIGHWLKTPPQERRTLIAAGSGAGLAAAFNAPLAGVIFVLEEIRRDFHPVVFGAAFLAAAIASIVVRLILGNNPDFAVPSYPTPPALSLPIFAVLGLLAGVLGVAFNRSLLGLLNLLERIGYRPVLPVAAAVGACVGLVGWFSPILVGGGHSLAELAIAGNVALAAIPMLFAVRFVLTTASYGTGAAGGIFAPLLALGALLGLGVGGAAHMVVPSAVPVPAVFAVVGMAAYFTAIVRVPLTGIVLIVEMTGNYQQMLPLLVACFCAYAVAEWMKDVPIYEALLERDLRREVFPTPRRSRSWSISSSRTGRHSWEYKCDLSDCPCGCVLVRSAEAGREFVRNALTRLEPHMRITALIAPEAAGALESLRRGCQAVVRNPHQAKEI